MACFIKLTAKEGDIPVWINFDLVAEIKPDPQGTTIYFAFAGGADYEKIVSADVTESPEEIMKLAANFGLYPQGSC